MSDQPVPRLNPDALKTERHDADLGTEAENDEHNHVGREPGRAPSDNAKELSQPTSGAIPPAR
jgi:hypothetical protein